MGRDKYLKDALSYVPQGDVEHYVILQGCSRPNWHIPIRFKVEEWPANVGIAIGMNKILPKLTGDLIMKMDDDCKIISPNFCTHIREIASLRPDIAFSPYPVGLIRNPGGVKAISHEVIYSKELDTYYTLRYVDHLGGFARISPAFTKEWVFDNDLIQGQSGNEDAQFSRKCQSIGMKMAYLENAIIVEHNESTLGQHKRYPDYFKDRF